MLDLALDRGLRLLAPVEGKAAAGLGAALERRWPDFGPWAFFPTRTEALAFALAAARDRGRGTVVRFRECRHPIELDAQIRIRFNDAATCEAAIIEPAAILLEPIPLRASLVVPAPDFLPRVRAAADACGAWLIADEGHTGLRFGARGSCPRLGVRPDVLVLGEALALGEPFGAVAALREHGPLGVSPEAKAPASALALLEATEDAGFHGRLDSLGALLARGLESAVADFEAPWEVDRLGSCVSFFPRGHGLSDPTHPARYDWPRYRRVAENLLHAGIAVAPDPSDPLFVSSSHTASELRRVEACVRSAFEDEAARS